MPDRSTNEYERRRERWRQEPQRQMGDERRHDQAPGRYQHQ